LKVLRPTSTISSSRSRPRVQRVQSSKSYDSDDVSNNHGGYKKHTGNEDQTSGAWTAHRKHFFILSSAGKPIYARYGDESRISSYMGVIQALISFYADNDDTIRCINAGQHRFVFLLKTPLYLVCVSRTGESEAQVFVCLMGDAVRFGCNLFSYPCDFLLISLWCLDCST
jgi:hypothetical protein